MYIINRCISAFIYIFDSMDAYLRPLVSCCAAIINLFLPDNCCVSTA